MSEPLTVTEAKTHLSRLVQEVLAGRDVLIGRRGRAEVLLTRAPSTQAPRLLGQAEGDLVMADDFDAPMDELADLMERDA